MFDDFKIEQPIAYKLLKKSVLNNKLSHAYLFETNNYENYKEFIMSFVKLLFCTNKYTNNMNCKNCHICENIDKNIYPELKIIDPTGLWIKKEDLTNLKEEFQTKSVQANKKIYVIYNAEKLNTSAANSILKFLEEPEENIVAILVTNNIHQILKTIISRCQVLSLKPNNKDNKSISSFLNKKYDLENLNQKITDTIDFLFFIEKNKKKSIVYEKKYFFDKFIDKDEIIDFFNISILLYKDAINYKLNRNLDFFSLSDINFLLENNIQKLNNKLQIFFSSKKNIKINVNNNLLIDKLIIDLGDV